jgi:hypothetical protein
MAIFLLSGCDMLNPPSAFSIQQITPDIIRADAPTSLTITGSGLDEVDYVNFGFSKRETNREEIASVSEISHIGASTIEVMTPELPGIDEKAKVWITVGSGDDESDAISVMFRPPNAIDLYGMYALIAAGGLVVLIIAAAFIRRTARRIAYRRNVLESHGRRLALRDERHARSVLSEIAAEKEAAQLKLEAEYLPYADQGTAKDSDE